MSKLIMWNLMTLDGYFEGETSWDLSFHRSVWGAELEAFSLEQLKTAECLVFGRTTYVGMADYWTHATEESDVAQYMNALPKLACSTTLQTADWSGTTISRDAVADLTRIKQEATGNLFVFGSGTLCRSLIQAGLFDEYRLCIAPVLLGKGKRLFSSGLEERKQRLLGTKTLETGGVIVRYAPA